jgi:hypothetical protein
MANPSDLPRYDDSTLRNDIRAAMQPLIATNAVILEHVPEPTEAGLKRCFAEGPWHVLHLVVHCEAQASANYGCIALNSSTGKARKLTAPYVAGLVAKCPSIRFVILQAAGGTSQGLETIARTMSEEVATVLTMPAIQHKAMQIFLSKLYSGLQAGLSADAVLQEILQPLVKEGVAGNAIRIFSNDSSNAIFARMGTESLASAKASAPLEEHITEGVPAAWHEQVNQKRLLGQFDVFLCHNSADKPAVKRIAQRLKESGILPWLDVWELPPGVPWQPLLEKQIDSIKSAAVFVGSAGFGPWQEQELYGFLRAFVRRKIPVIPVMLDDAPSQPELPSFLEGMTWVDFRNNDPDPMMMLTWGITGNRPTDD